MSDAEQKPEAWVAKCDDRIPQYFNSEKAARAYCGMSEWVISPLYTKTRPAVQRDVSGLVEALECILSMDDEIQIVDVMDSKAREMVEIARDALAAYRKQGGEK